jgi:hypothetical protein
MILDRTSAGEVAPDDIRELVANREREQNSLEFKAEFHSDRLLKAACAPAAV